MVMRVPDSDKVAPVAPSRGPLIAVIEGVLTVIFASGTVLSLQAHIAEDVCVFYAVDVVG
jgi:hypothetical protein